jgi:hypothetical protein
VNWLDFLRAKPLPKLPTVDVATGLTGLLLFGGASLAYPFGRDQGLYYYVGREWLHGAIPYRDVLDHKTPGIYAIHALSILAFGEHTAAIRVAEMFAVVTLGIVAAWLAAGEAARAGRAPFRGYYGVVVAVTAAIYYVFFDYWNTAQTELWYSTLGLLAIACARRCESDRAAFSWSGLFAGLAVIMKPPAIWFGFLAAALLLVRARPKAPGGARRAIASTLGFGVSFAAPVALTLGYFAAHGALGAMIDIVVGANSYYVKHERGVDGVPEMVLRTYEYFGATQPFSLISVAMVTLGSFLAVHTKDGERMRRYGMLTAVSLAALAATAMQQKFYPLHFGTMIAVWALTAANVLTEAQAFSDRLNDGRRGVIVGVSALLFLAVAGEVGSATRFGRETYALAQAALGNLPEHELAPLFNRPAVDFVYSETLEVSRYLNAQRKPGDAVSVRGFEPQIYALTGSRYPGRFFWTTFIVSPQRAYRREEWLAEDRRVWEETPPRFVVALRLVADGPDSPGEFLGRGYTTRYETPHFTVLERDAAGVEPHRAARDHDTTPPLP